MVMNPSDVLTPILSSFMSWFSLLVTLSLLNWGDPNPSSHCQCHKNKQWPPPMCPRWAAQYIGFQWHCHNIVTVCGPVTLGRLCKQEPTHWSDPSVACPLRQTPGRLVQRHLCFRDNLRSVISIPLTHYVEALALVASCAGPSMFQRQFTPCYVLPSDTLCRYSCISDILCSTIYVSER